MTTDAGAPLPLAGAHVHDLRRPDVHGTGLPLVLEAPVETDDGWRFAATVLDGGVEVLWLQDPAGRSVVLVEPAPGGADAESIATLLGHGAGPGTRRWARIRKAHRVAVLTSPVRYRPGSEFLAQESVALRAALAWAALTDDDEARWRAAGVDRGLRAAQFAARA